MPHQGELDELWAIIGQMTAMASRMGAFDGTFPSLSSKPTTVAGYGITDAYLSSNPSAYIAQAGARSALSLTATGSSGVASYNGSTGVFNVPNYTPSARSFANPARTLNTAFQISTTRDAFAVYTVDISVTSLLLAGASGRVYLEYADNAAMSTNLVTVSSTPNATGGVLNITNLGPGNVLGMIPANKWVRLRTQNVSATPTFTFQASQEVLL